MKIHCSNGNFPVLIKFHNALRFYLMTNRQKQLVQVTNAPLNFTDYIMLHNIYIVYYITVLLLNIIT